ncbi:MAG: endonuclease [Candidatus Aenigmarchaeota archaeon]|nr:endonuclease [Candidatus Aenigmarchaeota archaeon]
MLVEILVLLLFVLAAGLGWWALRLRARLREMAFGKRSLAVKYGKMSEQFLPFLEGYPHDPQLFRFLGTPIDGIQFADDKIVFVEFKVGDSRLSPTQQKIRALVEQGKVTFEEIRIK